MAPHTILFMAANPVGTDARALDEQARAIQMEIERAGRRDCFRFETRWGAQPLDLLRDMVKLKPTVVHFCGGRLAGRSGSALVAGVYFEGPDGRAQPVAATALATAFDAAGSSVKLVVLDACYSQAHAAAIVAHVDFVVGLAGETIDGAATSFAIGLYGGLGEGESVANAFKQGRAAIALMGVGNADQPSLVVRRGADANQSVLTSVGVVPASAAVAAPPLGAAVSPDGVRSARVRTGRWLRATVVAVAATGAAIATVAALRPGGDVPRNTPDSRPALVLESGPMRTPDAGAPRVDARREADSAPPGQPEPSVVARSAGAGEPLWVAEPVLYRLTRNHRERVADHGVLHSGDTIAVEIATSQAAYLYMLQRHDDGTVDVIVPSPEERLVRSLPHAITELPLTSAAYNIVLDRNTGNDIIYIVAALRPLDIVLHDRPVAESATGSGATLLVQRPVGAMVTRGNRLVSEPSNEFLPRGVKRTPRPGDPFHLSVEATGPDDAIVRAIHFRHE
jgi:hypothetical protein